MRTFIYYTNHYYDNPAVGFMQLTPFTFPSISPRKQTIAIAWQKHVKIIYFCIEISHYLDAAFKLLVPLFIRILICLHSQKKSNGRAVWI